MDALIRQMRRPRGQSEPEEEGDNANSVPALRRTRSSGEKTNKGWFQRQYSKQMSGSNTNHTPGDDAELAIAVAAAAYAVNILDEPEHGATITRGDSFLPRAKSKKEMITRQETYDPSKPFSGQQDPSLSSQGIQDSKERKLEPKPSNTGDGPVKTVQRRPTFAEKLQLDRTESGKPKQLLQEEEEYLPTPLQKPKIRTASSSGTNTVALPPPPPPPSPPSPSKFPATTPGKPPLFEIQSQATAEPTATRLPAVQLAKPQTKRQIGGGIAGGAATEGDAWERDEMARIRAQYEKLNQTIAGWEDDKKKKARHKLDEKEREIERRRAKAQKEFRTEMERIGQIAGGARAQAEERRRHEELKTREKGERIRHTGKAPNDACSCF